MTIIACPRCRDEVRVPARAPASATVRCPLCSEEYLLADALATLPPELIVIGGMAEEVSQDPYVTPASSAFADAGDYRMAGSTAGVSGGVFDTAGPGLGDGAVTRPLRGVRPQRKEKSMIAEFAKIMLGGVVGVFMAIAIIWWLGNKDPFQLGPKISPFAPWAVPAKFHAKPSNTTTTAATDSGGSGGVNNSSPAPAPNNKSNKLQTLDGFDPDNKFAKALGKSTNGDEEPPLGVNSTPLVTAEPLTLENPLELPNNPATTEPTLDDPLAAISTTTPPKSEPQLEPNLDDVNPAAAPTPSTTPPETPAATEPPQVTPADLAKSVEQAAAARAAYDKAKTDGADGATRKKVGAEMFTAIAAIGPLLAKLSPEDADNADAIDALKATLLAFNNPLDQPVAAYFADQKLADETSSGGVLLAGTVKDFVSVGGAFETKLELANKKRTVAVVSFKNPQDQFKLEDRVLIVGSIVRDPKTNLKGYSGDESLVITHGYSAVLPAE